MTLKAENIKDDAVFQAAGGGGVVERLIARVPLFANAAPGFLEALYKNARSKNYGKSHVLLLHGDKAEKFFLIRKGWVKLFRETIDGSQAVVDILTAGHVFGEAGMFEHDGYPYSAEIVEAAEIIALPLDVLDKEVADNPKMAYDMLASMTRHRRLQDREIEHRAIQNAPQRIGCFLLRLVQPVASGPVSVNLPYDKMLVAARLGMQPETFSRALSRLRNDLDITIRGATIEIDDVSALSDYVCGACSAMFPCSDLKSCDK